MIKLTLKVPIQFGTETIKELEFREATIKDLRRMPIEPTTGDFIDVAAILCNRPIAVLEQSSAANLTDILEVVSRFLASSRVTGER